MIKDYPDKKFVIIENEFGELYLNHLKKSSKKYISQDLLVIANHSKKLYHSVLSNIDNSEKECHPELVEESIIKTTQKGKFLVDGIAAELFMI